MGKDGQFIHFNMFMVAIHFVSFNENSALVTS
jgi:hypothetical protein